MKKIILFILVLSLLGLAACAPAQGGEVETTSGTTAAPTETTEAVILTPEELYDGLLAKLCKRLNKIIGDDTHLDGFALEEGMEGVAQIAMLGGVDMLQKIGYKQEDINGDGVPELLVCKINEGTTGNVILCAYTVADGQLALLFNSTATSNYYLLDDGTFYCEGTNCENGDLVAQTVFGVFKMDGAAVSCADYYFSVMNEDQQACFYHNQAGQLDTAASEAFEGDENAFLQVKDSLASGVQAIELITLAEFDS